MTKINKVSFFQKIRDKKSQKSSNDVKTQYPQATDTKYPNVADVSAATLASVSYRPKLSREEAQAQLIGLCRLYPEIKYHADKEFFEKFDYDNAQEHIDNISFLASKGSDFGYGSAFRSGYFYSKDGIDAINILKSRYSSKGVGSYRSNLDIAIGCFSPESVIKANQEGLFDTIKVSMSDFNKINVIADVLKNLNNEELLRLKKSGMLEKGIPYASENDDINRVFATRGYEFGVNNLKLIENLIFKDSENNDDIKNISNKLIALKNKKFIKNIIDNRFNKNKDNLDIKFLADNTDEIHSLIHSKIKNYEDSPFMGGFSSLLSKLNKTNFETFKNLVSVQGMNQHLLERTVDYLYSKENCEYVQNIIDKINSGEEELIGLPVYKYAQINPRVNSARDSQIQEFEENTPDEEISSKTKNGEVFSVGDSVYINEDGIKTLLGLDKNTYKKLFPPFKSLCIRQGDETGDCYFLSGGLIAFWKNDKAKAQLLKMFSMDGNDVIVTIPDFKKYPVRFPNGEIELGDKHADTSIGNLMLEQAYAKAKYCSENKIKNTAIVNSDKAMDYIYGGYESDVFNELLGTNRAKQYVNDDYRSDVTRENYRSYMNFVKQNQMYDILDKYADTDKYLLAAGTKTRDEGTMREYGISSKHAYAIENIDPENRTVTVINPYNSLYNAKISYEDFAEHFVSLSVCEV